MNYQEDKEKFKELLNNEYSWPTSYTFKFIVKSVNQQEVVKLFDDKVEITIKPSSGDKYVSVTIDAQMQSAEEITTIYDSAAAIPGIISL
jgi:putative lipoic acid-binding regulatory protein